MPGCAGIRNNSRDEKRNFSIGCQFNYIHLHPLTIAGKSHRLIAITFTTQHSPYPRTPNLIFTISPRAPNSTPIDQPIHRIHLQNCHPLYSQSVSIREWKNELNRMTSILTISSCLFYGRASSGVSIPFHRCFILDLTPPLLLHGTRMSCHVPVPSMCERECDLNVPPLND